jgi:hypothetical protein
VRLQLAVGLGVALACSPAHAESPWQATTDTLVYTDTDNVLVVSPQAAVHFELDEEGGEASARVVVDTISAASVDVVSQATNRFFEVRTEINLGLSKSFDFGSPSLSYRYSHEPDYDSHGGQVGFQRRLGSADTVLSLGYGLTEDTVGMTDTPSDVFSATLTTHSADVSLTQNLDEKTILRLVYTFTGQRGYMEKPYRFVPLFDRAGIDAANAAGDELDLGTFDRYRLPTKPTESVPDSRGRHAAALRAMRFVPSWKSSLRLDYRFYADSWSVIGHTVESAIHRKLGERQRLNVVVRFYSQSGSSFWRRVYEVEAMSAPRYRTLDRGLSPFHSLTAGGRYEIELGQFTVYGQLDAMQTWFRDYLFLDTRFALIGQTGVRWNF